MSSTVDVDGLDDLARRFDELANVARLDNLERAGHAGLLPVINEAKITVHKVSGDLVRSLHSQVAQRGGEVVVVRGGTDVEYAATEEFGDEFRPPHPYLRPAFDSKRAEAIQEAKAVLKELIQKSVRR